MKKYKHKQVSKFGKFRGSISLTERNEQTGSNIHSWHSQSSLQVLSSPSGECMTVELRKKEIEPLSLQNNVAVQYNSFSPLVKEAPLQQNLCYNSLLNLSESKSIVKIEKHKKALSLEEKRAIFQRKKLNSSENRVFDSDSSLDNSSEITVIDNLKNNKPNRIKEKFARHISVHKFDTFSTFEGTFDEDTGLGYLVGIDEDKLESLEQIKPASNFSQDSMVSVTHLTNDASTEKKEHLYKILVIGELGAGKTSIIKRYVHQFFSQHYRATIGVDFALKVLNWDPETIIRLQLWDIAGQERFGNMTRVYYKEAVGAFIVFDVTRNSTLDAVDKWKQDLDQKVMLPNGLPIPCLLLANKCDQPKEGLVTSLNKMDEYCRENNFIGWFETSAKENINIEEAANFLVKKILENEFSSNNHDLQNELPNERLTIHDSSMDSKKSCSC